MGPDGLTHRRLSLLMACLHVHGGVCRCRPRVLLLSNKSVFVLDFGSSTQNVTFPLPCSLAVLNLSNCGIRDVRGVSCASGLSLEATCSLLKLDLSHNSLGAWTAAECGGTTFFIVSDASHWTSQVDWTCVMQFRHQNEVGERQGSDRGSQALLSRRLSRRRP